MNKTRKAQLKSLITSHITYRKAYQSQPFTCVHVEAEVNGEFYVANGFSKVRWPDKWNAGYGEKLAYEKAVAQIVRELAEEKSNAR